MHRTWLRTSLTALTIALAASAAAQTTGRIEGTTVDSSGAPLPGVTVTVVGAQGERLTVSEANGRFRFLNLDPGEYRLRALLDGFTPVEQPGIVVTLDRTVTLQIKLTPAFAEQVQVEGNLPLFDTTDPAIGVNLDQTVISTLPVNRTFQSLIFTAPGVVDGGLGSNPSVNGASVAENRYILNGVDTTDPAFGTLGATLPMEFLEEVEIKTGGYEPEYGGAMGGMINVVTKGGGNELAGEIYGYWSDDSLQGEVPSTLLFGRALGRTEYDFGATVGGPLIQDKLWYFVAANPSRSEIESENRAGRVSKETNDTLFYAGKLTWQPHADHQLTLSVFGDPASRDNEATLNAAGLILDDREFGADSASLKYSGTWTPSLFAEAYLATYAEDVSISPERDVPFYQVQRFQAQFEPIGEEAVGELLAPQIGPCYEVGQFDSSFSIAQDCLGGSFNQGSGDTGRDEARASLTWFTETGPVGHELKFGAMTRKVEFQDSSRYPGPAPQPLVDANGRVIDADGLTGQRIRLFEFFYFYHEYEQASKGETDEQALYFQDRIRLNDFFTLLLGARADAFEAKGGLTPVNGLRSSFDFGFGDMIAPRVGFVWDVIGNGRSKLSGHYGRFYESVPLDINARAFGFEEFNFHYFYYPEDRILPRADHNGVWFSTFSTRQGVPVAVELDPTYSVETLLGFDYEIAPNWAAGLRYVDRSIHDVIEDFSVDGGQTFLIGNPSGTFTNHPVTGEPLAFTQVFPEPRRDYRGIEVSLTRRLRNNWQLYANYVHGDAEGNYVGLYNQDNGQLDPNLTIAHDIPSLLLNGDGQLPNDRDHQFKAYGSYRWPFGLVTGFFGQYLSGTPISKLGAHSTYGNLRRFVEPRGTAGRTPDVWTLDLHLEYPFSLSRRMELKLVADVFNATDQEEAVAVDQEWTTRRAITPDPSRDCGGPGTGQGTDCPLGNPNFGSPTAYQLPRTVRLGLKLSF